MACCALGVAVSDDAGALWSVQERRRSGVDGPGAAQERFAKLKVEERLGAALERSGAAPERSGAALERSQERRLAGAV